MNLDRETDRQTDRERDKEREAKTTEKQSKKMVIVKKVCLRDKALSPSWVEGERQRRIQRVRKRVKKCERVSG